MQKLIAGARRLDIELSPHQLEQFEVYYRELVDWNRRMNLTAITSYDGVQTKHFLDSLTIVLAFKPPAGASPGIIDIGTGAGLPGIPLKILFPNIRLALLEATAKKAAFLKHITQHLELADVEIIVSRAELAARDARYREHFDIALSRAVAALPAAVELALPFCTIGGSFIAQKKGAIDEEITQAHKAIEILGGKLREVKRIELPELADDRYLVIIEKISPTPEKYPRHPGMPEKRPIV